ncbi:hypothetical protein CRV24_008594 [Beauveria bassiana]|nr:hypothetical protein CRV24_008594 [Beauveria bassiana]KAH8716678.1 hypothetical protein HC256_005437 [Beauveria bassiana]
MPRLTSVRVMTLCGKVVNMLEALFESRSVARSYALVNAAVDGVKGGDATEALAVGFEQLNRVTRRGRFLNVSPL